MTDKKSVASIIKTLERTIGILENCSDIGEMADVTRKRIIEMLNTATMTVFFMGSKETTENNTDISGLTESDMSAGMHLVIEELEEEYNTQTESKIPEISAVESNEIPAVEDNETLVKQNIQEIPKQEPEKIEEIIYPEEDTITEDFIFNQQALVPDKPIIEWEAPSEPANAAQDSQQETQIKDELNILKTQLEEERNRLEQELQNWQDEKRRRDEEIQATQKLLAALQQQQQNVKQANTAPIISQSVIQETKVEPAPIKFAEAPVIKKEDSQGSLIDSYLGSKKVLHENFEVADTSNHISTPVSDLQKAIGINDKFRFIKELFGGDYDLYIDTINQLNSVGSLPSAISYIESRFVWDKNSDSVKQLISLIRRRYM